MTPETYKAPRPVVSSIRTTDAAVCDGLLPESFPEPVRLDVSWEAFWTSPLPFYTLGSDGEGNVFIGGFGRDFLGPGNERAQVYTRAGSPLGVLEIANVASTPVAIAPLASGFLTSYLTPDGCELRRYDLELHLVGVGPCELMEYVGGTPPTAARKRGGFFVHPDGSSIEILVAEQTGEIMSRFITAAGELQREHKIGTTLPSSSASTKFRIHIVAQLDARERLLVSWGGVNSFLYFPFRRPALGRWLDPQAVPIGDEFVIAEKSPVTDMQRLLGDGIALQLADDLNHYSLFVHSGETRTLPAPYWLTGQPFRRYSRVRSGKAYLAGIPQLSSSEPERFELIASDGTSCGYIQFEEPGGACDGGGFAIGLDGTVIRASRRTLRVGDGRSTAVFWWPALLR